MLMEIEPGRAVAKGGAQGISVSYPARQHLIYGGDQDLRVHRFCEKAHPATQDYVVAGLSSRNKRSKKQDGAAGHTGIAHHLTSHFTAVFARHIDIEQDDIGAKLARDSESLGGSIFYAHLIAFRFFEEKADNARKLRVIVHEEDAGLVHIKGS